MLLDRSVMGWSYEDKFSKARLDQLDARTADWLFGAIADQYVSPEDEGDSGEGSTPFDRFLDGKGDPPWGVHPRTRICEEGLWRQVCWTPRKQPLPAALRVMELA